MVNPKSLKNLKPNLKGRPPIIAEVRELARQHTTTAIEKLAEILNDEGENAVARIAAARELLDRGYGKSKEITENTHQFVAEEADESTLIARASEIAGRFGKKGK